MKSRLPLLTAACLSCLASSVHAAAPRPNLILIMSDDVGYSDTGCYAGENPRTYTLVRRYLSRPAEEPYHTAADPAEMTNLAGKPEHAAIQKKLSAELDRWLAARNDPDVPLDTVEAHSAAQRGQPIFPAKP